MSHLPILAVAATLLAAGCSKDSAPTTPSGPQNRFTFTATLLPASERPNPVTNAEAGGSGTVTITMNVTRDAAGVITAATTDYNASFTGFPAGTALTAAHIHTGDANTAGGPTNNLGLTAGEVTFPNGSGTLVKTGVGFLAPVDTVNAIINNPGGFYFNVHTALNPGGVARGQLVRTS
mgnify:CR=1 FL=1